MARVLGYGGLANTNGARNFSGKVAAVVALVNRIPDIPLIPTMPTMAKLDRRMRITLQPIFAMLGVFK